MMQKNFEFKPFDKVLVRDNDGDVWSCSLYSNEFKDEYHCIGGFWGQCIPYEGNEHLLGTTDDYVSKDGDTVPKNNDFVPKDGDFVTIESFVSKIKFTAICQNYKSFSMLYYVGTVGRERNEIHFHSAYSLGKRDIVTPATEEEKQHLLSKLHENGKGWDAEKKEVVDWKWEPTDNEKYYYVNSVFIADTETWTGNLLDEQRYKRGNCFRTEEECQTMCDKLNEAIKNVK